MRASLIFILLDHAARRRDFIRTERTCLAHSGERDGPVGWSSGLPTRVFALTARGSTTQGPPFGIKVG